MTGPYVVRHLAQDERTGPSGEASHEMRVVSVKAFETLEEPGEDGLQWHVDLLIEELGGSIDEHKDVTADGARLELPGGAILVEETTWDALIDEYVPDAYYALGDDEDSRQVRAELIATANAAMAERYGTEGR